ncbi:MAG: glycosyltransferase family protein [Planctomycetota bacterium]|nr:glycosyltransferase family protein [Planctomycetota bacterium]
MKIEVLAILQARMGSSRLPGKMMRPIVDGKGALELMLGRVRRATTLDRIVVATTDRDGDDILAEVCSRLEIDCFRGSEEDVLDRFYRVAVAYGPTGSIVRLTGDCPLHDPAVIDLAVGAFLEQGVDYLSNTAPPTYPHGLDTEVFTFSALEESQREARLSSEREHVTPYIRSHPERFQQGNLANDKDLSALRWTLDEPEDLEFIRAVYASLGDRSFGMAEVLGLLESRPQLSEINRGFTRTVDDRKPLPEEG